MLTPKSISHPVVFSLLSLLLLLIFSAHSSQLYSQNPNEFPQVGKASFYANKFEGKKTASGEIYLHKDYTAAHRSLPFGTWVKV
ncbi:septal ring lytic transglycosylase RlpA family protein [Labilibaculum sp.]|uniref:septal ring lytic transglycosylase RlpA family protein n=1 Tax=Labilibaculum sp. TaxID=2060723 RepID=UPI0035687068